MMNIKSLAEPLDVWGKQITQNAGYGVWLALRMTLLCVLS